MQSVNESITHLFLFPDCVCLWLGIAVARATAQVVPREHQLRRLPLGCICCWSRWTMCTGWSTLWNDHNDKHIQRIWQHNTANIHNYIHRRYEDKKRWDNVPEKCFEIIDECIACFIHVMFFVMCSCCLICFGNSVLAVTCNSWGSRDLHSDHWLSLACDVRFGVWTATVCNWWIVHPRIWSSSLLISGWTVQSFEVGNGMFQQTQLINIYIYTNIWYIRYIMIYIIYAAISIPIRRNVLLQMIIFETCFMLAWPVLSPCSIMLLRSCCDAVHLVGSKWTTRI